MSALRTVHYHLILADSDLVDHPTAPTLSAAGAPGLVRYTPAYDAEVIALGMAQSDFPDGVGSLMLTGARSPAVGVHRLLLDLKNRGHVVHVHVYAVGLRHRPSLKGAASVFSCEYLEFETELRRLYNCEPASDYNRQRAAEAGSALYGNIAADRDAIHVVGECVPTGTTTAAIRMGMLVDAEFMGWNGSPMLRTPGSQHDNHDNREGQILKGLGRARVAERDAVTRVMHDCGDLFQLAMKEFWDQVELYEADLDHVVFGGGLQMMVVTPSWADARADLRIVTTPYVREAISTELRRRMQAIWPSFRLRACPDFARQAPPGSPWGRYALGYAKEGCGLGAVAQTWCELTEVSRVQRESALLRVLGG